MGISKDVLTRIFTTSGMDPQEASDKADSLIGMGGQALSSIPGLSSLGTLADNAPDVAGSQEAQDVTKVLDGNNPDNVDLVPNPGNPLAGVSDTLLKPIGDAIPPEDAENTRKALAPQPATDGLDWTGGAMTPPEEETPLESTPSASGGVSSGGSKAPALPAKSGMEAILPSDAASTEAADREAMKAQLEKRRKLGAIPEFLGGAGDAIENAGVALGGKGATGDTAASIHKNIGDDITKQEGDFEANLLNDPNSDASKSYRAMVVRIVPDMAQNPAFQKMTAKMIGDKLPLIDTMMKAKSAEDMKRLQMEAIKAQKEISVGLRDDQQQDKLEKDARALLTKHLSNRSGGLGLQDMKVNQAIDLQTMLNDARDPKTGIYHIPPSMHTELAIGLQRLLSPAGAGSTHLTEELRQKTAKEGLSGALIYMGFDPKEVGGTTQSVSEFFANAVKRQGLTAEKLRNTYVDQLKNQLPSRLSPEQKERFMKQEVGSNYSDFLGGNDTAFGAKPRAAKSPAGAVQHNDPLGILN